MDKPETSELAEILKGAALELSARIEEIAVPLEEADQLQILDDAGWELVAHRDGEETHADRVVRLVGSYIVNSRSQPDWSAKDGGAT